VLLRHTSVLHPGPWFFLFFLPCGTKLKVKILDHCTILREDCKVEISVLK
jgi:hypothetical protein